MSAVPTPRPCSPRSHPPRVVSLVPSASETLVALGVAPIACTRFCELDDVPIVGGTKRPDVRAIVDLAPDLVVVNDEENRWDDAAALIDAGLAVHSMSPRSVHDVGGEVRALAARAPNLVILPSEPYAFGPEHGREIELEVGGVPIVFVDGRDLFWWGIRTPAAAGRIAAVLAGSRAG